MYQSVHGLTFAVQTYLCSLYSLLTISEDDNGEHEAALVALGKQMFQLQSEVIDC